ncbi:endonuclease/exonuclease/phosphatase family protein [Arachidicoccus sp.]|jgi:endonuclease/exonuclease/phosphatase family metal-dependent hydrolase|uniref:endonuclease/exonuclease/phosphatase family protein n=1 Tax=Arachidicoccus sp. TaxID=1872624 RepID=UPI003D1B1AAE
MRQIFKANYFFIYLIFCIGCNTVKNDAKGNLDSKTLTIVSYNVRNGVGLDNVVNYQRVANAIKKINPDIVAIQELDSATRRAKGVYVLNKLATFTAMIPTFHTSINFDGGKYGIGILSKEKPLNIRAIALPGTEERRSAVLVEMKNYIFVCTHFSLTEKDRMLSVALLDKFTAKYTKPVFLAGDLNSNPNSPAIEALSKKWQLLSDTSKLTIPANHPVDCIDYIMALKQKKYSFKVLEAVVGNEPVASDHLPVCVKLQIKTK